MHENIVGSCVGVPHEVSGEVVKLFVVQIATHLLKKTLSRIAVIT